jgi:hypothetical protein
MGTDEELSRGAGSEGGSEGEGGSRVPEFDRERQGGGGGGGSDAGWGSTNIDSGPGGREKTGREFARRTSDRTSDKTGDFYRIYAPKETRVLGKDEAASYQVGEGESLGSIEVKTAPNQDEGAYVPYDAAPRPGKSATERQVERAPIPREYREAVRRYFDDDE